MLIVVGAVLLIAHRGGTVNNKHDIKGHTLIADSGLSCAGGVCLQVDGIGAVGSRICLLAGEEVALALRALGLDYTPIYIEICIGTADSRAENLIAAALFIGMIAYLIARVVVAGA